MQSTIDNLLQYENSTIGGYGFILNPTKGGENIYFNHRAIVGDLYDDLEIGHPVEFDLLVDDDGKLKAENIVILTQRPLTNLDSTAGSPNLTQNLLQTHDLIGDLLTAKKWKDPQDFETYTFTLLKLLGIHNIFRHPPQSQNGRPDGFFNISGLSVIYDCTLRTEFAEQKRDQIKNYASRMRMSPVIEAPRNQNQLPRSYSTNGTDKQVWIITQTGTSKTMEIIDDIAIKRINVEALLALLKLRIGHEFYGTREIVQGLANLGENQF